MFKLLTKNPVLGPLESQIAVKKLFVKNQSSQNYWCKRENNSWEKFTEWFLGPLHRWTQLTKQDNDNMYDFIVVMDNTVVIPQKLMQAKHKRCLWLQNSTKLVFSPNAYYIIIWYMK